MRRALLDPAAPITLRFAQMKDLVADAQRRR